MGILDVQAEVDTLEAEMATTRTAGRSRGAVMAHSFFHLTTPRPAPSEENPLLALTPEEFEAFCAEAQPLFQALVETVNTTARRIPSSPDGLLHRRGYAAGDAQAGRGGGRSGCMMASAADEEAA